MLNNVSADALERARNSLSALSKKKRIRASLQIADYFRKNISAARASGHTWSAISSALSAAGVPVSASSLRRAFIALTPEKCSEIDREETP